MNPLKTEQLADGIYFHFLTDQRFKTNRISIHLFTPLQVQTAAQNAVIPALLRKRTQDYPDMIALNRKLQSLYGAYLGGDVRKAGDAQVITLAVSWLDDRFAMEGENLTAQTAELLMGTLLRPVLEDGLFSEEDLAVEKQSMLELLASELNDKRAFAVARTAEILCDGKGYGCNKYGSVETIKRLTAKQVTQAYFQILKQAQTHILFLGSGDPSCVREVIQNNLKGIQRGDLVSVKTEPLSPRHTLRRETDHLEVSQSKLVLGFSVDADSEREKLAALLMSFLYGGTAISNLFLNVREKLSLCYYCLARYDQMKGILIVDSGVEQKNAQKAEVEILKQLEEIRQGHFEEERLQNTILAMRNGFTMIGDSAGALETWYLTRIAAELMRSPEEVLAMLSEIGKDEVVEAARATALDAVYLLTGEETK